MATCPTCNGSRRITRTVRNMCGPSNNRYQSSILPFVDRHFECSTCAGTGHVACPVCSDRGEYPVGDAWGDFDTIEFCNCEAGRDLQQSELESEIERISHEAADQVHADYLYHLNAPVEYGMTVAVDEVPF